MAKAKGFDGMPCAFCAGERLSGRKGEHIPYRSMFSERLVGSGKAQSMPDKRLDCPACDSCNKMTRNIEPFLTLVALRLADGSRPGYAEALAHSEIHCANNDHDALNLLNSWSTSQTFLDGRVRLIGAERQAYDMVDARIGVYGAKLGMSYYWNEFHRPLPKTGGVWTRWNTASNFPSDPELLSEKYFGIDFDHFKQGNSLRNTEGYFEVASQGHGTVRGADICVVKFNLFRSIYMDISLVSDIRPLKKDPKYRWSFRGNPPWRPGLKQRSILEKSRLENLRIKGVG